MTTKDLKDIPVLATKDLVVFPNTSVPLAVASSANKINVKAASEEEKLIYIVPLKDGKHPKSFKIKDLYQTGTLCRIEQIKQQASGAYQLMLTSLKRISFENFSKDAEGVVRGLGAPIYYDYDLDKKVKVSDVDRVITAAQAYAIPDDSQLLHVLPRDYIIDQQNGIKEPLGMAGVRLETKVHLVTCNRNSAQNISSCMKACGITVEGFVLEQLASSYSVLSEDEKELGTCLIDMGGGTSDVAVFQNGAISHTANIPTSGDHITKDIARALQTPSMQAEELKKKYGCASSSKQWCKYLYPN